MNDMSLSTPILYSFRRCPYAMRARMALVKAGINAELREVELKNKPDEMLQASPKGSVPVLILPGGKVIDESKDIMYWALSVSDPDNWLIPNKESIDNIIKLNDTKFKHALDRYKYPNRYPDEDCSGAKDTCLEILKNYEQKINGNGGFIATSHLSMADIAVFPFIRQYVFVNKGAFDSLPLPKLHEWFDNLINSSIFKIIMVKNEPWKSEQSPIYLI